MGILDEAIKEHLELKRQHGAGESELRQLEDEAFGAAERPAVEAPASEAPTEFMAQPDLGEGEEGEAGPSEAASAATGAPPTDETPRRRTEIADLQEPPAMEHEAVSESETSGPSTEERHVIAEQPTEMYDVEEGFEDAEAQAPSEEELVEEEIGEPRLAPVDPLSGIDATDDAAVQDEAGTEAEDEEYDDFWDEKRLSDELDQALDAPASREGEEYDEPEADAEQLEAPGADDDVLEETPDFLEEAPEDDQLWFEQKPPKDFDFDD